MKAEIVAKWEKVQERVSERARERQADIQTEIEEDEEINFLFPTVSNKQQCFPSRSSPVFCQVKVLV